MAISDYNWEGGYDTRLQDLEKIEVTLRKFCTFVFGFHGHHQLCGPLQWLHSATLLSQLLTFEASSAL